MCSDFRFCVLGIVASSMTAAVLAAPPEGWRISSRSTVIAAAPDSISISQHNDITNYYLGKGKIYRTVFILPGHIPSLPEEVQLDSKRTAQLEQCIEKVMQNHPAIAEIVPPSLAGATTYTKTDFVFRTPGSATVTLSLSTLSDMKQKTDEQPDLLNDLKIIQEILNTRGQQ